MDNLPQIVNSNESQLVVENGPQLTLNPARKYLLSLRSTNSRNKMANQLNNIARHLGYDCMDTFPWQKINSDVVEAFILTLVDNGLAPNTVNLYLSAFKGVMKRCFSSDLIDARTYTLIKEIKSVKGSRVSKGRALPLDELNALYAAAEDLPPFQAKRDSLVVALMYHLGLRREEVISLHLANFDLVARTMRVVGKGNKERQLRVVPMLMMRIEDYLTLRGKQPGPLLLRVNRNGDRHPRSLPLQESGVRFALERLAAAAGVPQFAPHDMRRSFATHLFEAEVDVFTVQNLMGHADPSTTRRYDKRHEISMDKAMELLG